MCLMWFMMHMSIDSHLYASTRALQSGDAM
jgi:hypothetical protein